MLDLRQCGYLVVQLLVLFVPAILVTENYPDPFRFGIQSFNALEFYLGVSAAIISGITQWAFGEWIGKRVFVLLYASLASLIYVRFYAPTWKRFFQVTMINACVAVWSIFFGFILMALSGLD